MAADCSDSLGTQLVCCVPHNGLSHEESTQGLFTVHLSAVSLESPCLTSLLSLCFDGDSAVFTDAFMHMRGVSSPSLPHGAHPPQREDVKCQSSHGKLFFISHAPTLISLHFKA